jgi:hypothetical protein
VRGGAYSDALVERQHVLGGGLEVRRGIVGLGDEGLVLAAVLEWEESVADVDELSVDGA